MDGAVRRIETVYDVRGQVQKIRSYDSQSTLVNDVLLEYNAFGQLSADYQEHGGGVNVSTTPKVQYVFADGSANHVRRTQTVYPNGRILHYGYTSGRDDTLSRVSFLADDSSGTPGQHLAEYTYLGLGTNGSAGPLGGRGAGGEGVIVRVTSPEPQIRYDLAHATGSSDPYAGLDRFGRVVDLVWRKYNTSTDLVRIGHGYDRAGNRRWRQDAVAAGCGNNLDELYSYDGMNQLVGLQRGLLNSSKRGLVGGSKNFAESWTLDMTGNWPAYKQDTDGDGTWDLDQTRTHNAVNEILTASGWATPAHDRAGNMTTVPKPGAPSTSFTCTYDAWNRLVKVVDATTSNTVAEYAYDGRNFRIVKKRYTSGVLSEIRHSYYNADWQELEQRVATPIPNPQSLIPASQFVWGLRYIDDLILRDRDTNFDGTLEERLYALQDANWNVVAIANTSGAVQERYIYTAYGTPTFRNGYYWFRSASSYDWETLFTGRQYDRETGLGYFRMRYDGFHLGRFLGIDPMGYAFDEANPYRYVGNRTILAVDPHGLRFVFTGPLFVDRLPGATLGSVRPDLVIRAHCQDSGCWDLVLDDFTVRCTLKVRTRMYTTFERPRTAPRLARVLGVPDRPVGDPYMLSPISIFTILLHELAHVRALKAWHDANEQSIRAAFSRTGYEDESQCESDKEQLINEWTAKFEGLRTSEQEHLGPDWGAYRERLQKTRAYIRGQRGRRYNVPIGYEYDTAPAGHGILWLINAMDDLVHATLGSF